MTAYRLEQNELSLNATTEKAYARFNEQLQHPEQLAYVIGVTALGYAEMLDEDEQEMAATALDVLEATNDGMRLDASDATWGAIHDNAEHRAARYDVHTTNDPIDQQIAIRRRGFCALRAVALAQLPKEIAEQAPTLANIEREVLADKFASIS